MRVLVCGGRDFEDARLMRQSLRELEEEKTITCIIHGDARGADRLAGSLARASRREVEVYPADWERDGKAAGPIRNARMLKEGKPDVVLAMAGGRGTAHMVSIARRAGVRVVEPA